MLAMIGLHEEDEGFFAVPDNVHGATENIKCMLGNYIALALGFK